MESECLATSLMAGELEKAIDHCTASCSFLAAVMPKYHPLTILQFVTLAELSMQAEMWEEAKLAYEIGEDGRDRGLMDCGLMDCGLMDRGLMDRRKVNNILTTSLLIASLA